MARFKIRVLFGHVCLFDFRVSFLFFSSLDGLGIGEITSGYVWYGALCCFKAFGQQLSAQVLPKAARAPVFNGELG